ncbi:DNA-3-methyladenine glycosylase i [Fimbriimonas ginsengisoli Gsoil 348]|uniref:DNA-3-methyladenine glycosylase i n=1 Tax=Fimbriimonas ginsengisoli Gsoil 348 TaxID=661478 RepID=A0A068NKQ2_FIMGI|nr:DNA-3-methyladenine glycosylase i [Fimbriimonas ginsengisoli Gsoil 348]
MSDLMARYHDEEWGIPCHDDDRLFEMLSLEGAQAGLSWETVLKKREGYRQEYHGFRIARVAEMTPDDVERILQNPGVIRHRGKLESVVSNAKAVIEIQREYGSLSTYLWSFVGNAPIVNRESALASTPESDAMSKALKKRGFKFVGSTIVYAFMQACGMADDHSPDCFRAKEQMGVRRKA